MEVPETEAQEGQLPHSHGLTDVPNAADKGRRRSLVDICTWGIIADPWRRKPWGAEWRSSPAFLTAVVTFGITTDLLTYSIVVPVLPYRFESLGYTNISSYTSILLICYSGGLAICTPPVCYYFFKYPYRRAPMLVSLVILQLALILFMLATPFWCMCVARILQGGASSIVWSVGMALICENVDHNRVGTMLGFALSGVTVGTTIGPILGGVLYDRLGWYAPFVLCIVVCMIDFVGRLVLVERKEVVRWGIGIGEDLRSLDDDGKDHSTPTRAAESTENQTNAIQASPIERHTEEALPTSNTISGKTIVDDGEVDINLEEKNGQRESTQRRVSSLSKNVKTKPLTPIGVIVKLCSSPRAVTSFGLCFAYGCVIGSQEPSLTLRIQDVWNRSSTFVGIVYLVASIPGFFTGPIAGYIADKAGAEVLVPVCLLLSLPWQPLLGLKSSRAGFIMYFLLSNGFMGMVLSPIGRELAVVSKTQEGIGEIHQFGAFNMAFAISTCIGPLFGGQVYDRLSNGWIVLTWLWLAILAVCIPPALWYTGERPLGKRLWNRMKGRRDIEGGQKIEASA